MKIDYTMDSFRNVGFFAEPEEQDGYPPSGSLITNLAPTFFSGARNGLACALAFGSFASGILSFRSKIAPLTATLIQRLMPNGEVFVDTRAIDFKPTDIQLGKSTLHVLAADSFLESTKFVDAVEAMPGNHTHLCILKNDGVRGFLSSPRGRLVCSNYWLRSNLSSASDALMALCAIALMYSEDLGAGRILLYGAPEVEDPFWNALSDVFYSVGISLERAKGNEEQH